MGLATTRFPALHETLTGEAPVDPETLAIRQDRAKLIVRQVGMPENRDELRRLTHAQLERECGK